MSIRQKRPFVLSPESRTVYVSPTTPTCGRLWSVFGRASVIVRWRSSGGIVGAGAVLGVSAVVLIT